MKHKRIDRYAIQKTKKQKRKLFFRFFIFFHLFVFVGVSVVGFYAWRVWEREMENVSQVAKESIQTEKNAVFKKHFPTVFYDQHGQELLRLSGNRYMYAPYQDISPFVIKAAIAVEDERFLKHKGVDYQSIARAGVSYLKNKGEITEGGSTITQQLVKNVYLTPEQTFERKMKEAAIAQMLEKEFSKEDILEFYLNNIYFGNGCYGIETASQFYFQKKASDLHLEEAAFLMSIPNRPTYYNPFTYPEHTEERKKRILNKMIEVGSISSEKGLEAMEKTVTVHVQSEPEQKINTEHVYIEHDATLLLMKKNGFVFRYAFDSKEDRKNYEQEYRVMYKKQNDALRTGNYEVYTSLDVEKQKQLQQAVNDGLSRFATINKETGQPMVQGSAVVLDTNTGNVLAIVGGRTQEDTNNWYNRAFMSYRQPGSAIKPFVAFAPAFERGMTPNTVMTDKPIKKGPRNWDGKYRGAVTLRFAHEHSINTIPFQLVKQMGPKNMLHYLTEMNFSNIVVEDEHAGIGVGGFTYGATTLEMAGAYRTLAKEGVYTEPHIVQKIVDKKTGTIIVENIPTEKRIYSVESSKMMNDVLESTIRKQYRISIPKASYVGGKTGTTNDSKDGWFAGFTPEYTTVVWVGADNSQAIQGLYGATYPKNIWKSFMYTQYP